MAIMTSFEKNFEITALSFSPAVILPDQETTYSITVKNTSGRKITGMRADMGMYYATKDGAVRKSATVVLYGGSGFDFQSISWASNATKTFTGTFKLSENDLNLMSSETRTIPLFKGSDAGFSSSYGGNETLGMMLSFTTNVTFVDGSNSDLFFNIRGENSEYLLVLDAKYKPAITIFDAERSSGADPDDEGENLLATIGLSVSSEAKLEYLGLELRYRARGDSTSPTNVIDITSAMTEALDNTILTLINNLFEKNTDWDVTLWFGDQYENATAAIVVSRAFANVHLSGASTGGVCFGGFSQATEGNPLFQCYYPAEIKAGIKGGFTYSLGEVNTGGRWIDDKFIFRRVVPVSLSVLNTRTEIAVLPETEAVINTYGFVTRSGDQRFPLFFWYGSENYHSIWMESPTQLVGKTSHAISGYVILEYTKTT